jgi:hypothetical protein
MEGLSAQELRDLARNFAGGKFVVSKAWGAYDARDKYPNGDSRFKDIQVGGFKLRPERPRARRCPFVALIELTDVGSDAHTTANTTNLSLSGCRLEKQLTLSIGSKVRIRISRRGEKFTAFGRIVRVRLDGETGIIFTGVESADRATLDKWLAESRGGGRR